MRPQKPIYPPPWWSECEPPVHETLSPGDEITVCFVGYDANGNALFSIKRPPCVCEPRPGCFPIRRPRCR